MAQLFGNIVLTFSIYLLLGQSFSVIYYTVKFFHIAHAAILTLSAYFGYLFIQQLQFPFFLSIFLAISCSTVLGVLLELLIYRHLRRRNSSALMLLIVSLGLYIVLQNLISLFWGDETKVIQLGEVEVGKKILGAFFTNVQIYTIIICLSLFICVSFFIKKSKIGRNLRAVGNNVSLSNILGINPNKSITLTFLIGSFLVSVVGILIAFDVNMYPTMGFSWLLYGVVVMIISGIGSQWGVIAGALLLATIQHVFAYYIGSQWMDTIAYMILILFLIWKPLGFSGKQLKKTEI